MEKNMDNLIVKQLTKAPSFKKIKKALFIQPHPDDNQIGAGGLMALLVDQGAKVYELTVTDDRHIGEQTEPTIRQRETLDCQAFLGLENAGFLGFRDKTQESVESLSLAILEVIRKVKPDAVFTVDPNLASECHSDHIKVGNAVKFAVMDAPFDFFPYKQKDDATKNESWTVPILAFYYTDQPNKKVDISKYIDKKMESIKCHKSQVDSKLLYFIKELAKITAKGTKYKYAESFRALSQLHMHCFTLPIEKDFKDLE